MVNGVTVSNCPGAMVVQGTTATYCCVGATGFSMSLCDGFPFCSTTTDTLDETAATATDNNSNDIAAPTCSTTIPLSATNFAQLVDSASQSLASAAAAATAASTGAAASSTGSQAQQTHSNVAHGLKASSAALVGAMVFLAML